MGDKSDRSMEWLEANIDNAIKGLDLIVRKMYDQLRAPERLTIAILLQRDGRKRLSELIDELSLSREVVIRHIGILQRHGIVSTRGRKNRALEGNTTMFICDVRLTPIGENMMKCLEEI